MSYRDGMANNARSLGRMDTAAQTLLSRRLVCRTATSDKEYIGVVAATTSGAETIYYGYCKWARVGARHQTAVYYRGPNLDSAIAVVQGKLRSKLVGRAGSRYETEDGRSVERFDDHRNHTGARANAGSDTPEVATSEAAVPVERAPETLASALLRRRGLPPNASIGDIMRRR